MERNHNMKVIIFGDELNIPLFSVKWILSQESNTRYRKCRIGHDAILKMNRLLTNHHEGGGGGGGVKTLKTHSSTLVFTRVEAQVVSRASTHILIQSPFDCTVHLMLFYYAGIVSVWSLSHQIIDLMWHWLHLGHFNYDHVIWSQSAYTLSGRPDGRAQCLLGDLI